MNVWICETKKFYTSLIKTASTFIYWGRKMKSFQSFYELHNKWFAVSWKIYIHTHTFFMTFDAECCLIPVVAARFESRLWVTALGEMLRVWHVMKEKRWEERRERALIVCMINKWTVTWTNACEYLLTHSLNREK